jgi:hypothetical protein
MYLLEKKGLNCWIDGPVLFIRKTEGDFVKQRAELIENLSMMVVEPEFIANEIEYVFQ